MDAHITEILQKPYDAWTETERADIKEFCTPFREKPLSQMTVTERQTLLSMYLSFVWHYDARRRAIAFAILTEGFTASEIGAIQLKSKTMDGAIQIGESGIFMDDEIIRGCRRYMRGYAPNFTIEYPREHTETRIFRDFVLPDYLWNARGFMPGPLFYMERKQGGVKNPISVQAVQRVLRPATAAFSLAGAGQIVQFCRIADGLRWQFANA